MSKFFWLTFIAQSHRKSRLGNPLGPSLNPALTRLAKLTLNELTSYKITSESKSTKLFWLTLSAQSHRKSCCLRSPRGPPAKPNQAHCKLCRLKSFLSPFLTRALIKIAKITSNNLTSYKFTSKSIELAWQNPYARCLIAISLLDSTPTLPPAISQLTSSSPTLTSFASNKLTSNKLTSNKLTLMMLTSKRSKLTKLTSNRLTSNKLTSDKLTLMVLTSNRSKLTKLTSNRLTQNKLTLNVLTSKRSKLTKHASNELTSILLTCTPPAPSPISIKDASNVVVSTSTEPTSIKLTLIKAPTEEMHFYLSKLTSIINQAYNIEHTKKLSGSNQISEPTKVASKKLRNQRSPEQALRQFINSAHVSIIKWRLLLSGDIEPNPGPHPAETPETSIRILTQNCRGMGEHKKLKLILNKSQAFLKKKSSMSAVLLQEIMIKDDSQINIAWRGNYVFTPGTGHGRGCLTLLNANLTPNNVTRIEDRAHVFKLQHSRNNLVVANIYAPTGLNDEKINFFRRIISEINKIRDPEDDVILGGDFNLIFHQFESKHRRHPEREQRMANHIKQLLDDANLIDAWSGSGDKQTHTWRRNAQSSRLDRILYSLNNCKQQRVVADWTFTNSDHAAVIVEMCNTQSTSKTSIRMPRLDPSFLNSDTFRTEFLTEYHHIVGEQPEHWDPHKILEFHKCAIRTAYSTKVKELRAKETSNLETLKSELDALTSTAENSQNPHKLNRLTERINQVRAKIMAHNNLLGQRLADKLKTKWYNEGEMSNKYFLGLLKRQTNQGKLKELIIDGKLISNEKEIEAHVKNFYQSLYNQKRNEPEQTRLDEVIALVPPLQQEDITKALYPLNTHDLEKTLKKCTDSAPGPDGIPYSFLKLTWPSFGNKLLDSWRHSLITNSLPQSHNESILKLLPKAGKDLKEIKNWRPITLSNCDHKLITKTLSRKLTEALNNIITGTQTAYIHNRSISDNLRIINMAVKLAEKDPTVEGLVVALDAKKAFDSVTHSYIKSLLLKIGLERFIPIFELLYKDQVVKININDNIIDGYNIKNGVKQGDSLSCILFVLAMEPLIRNIEARAGISSIKSNRLRIELPKCLGYADDISVLCENSGQAIKEIMTAYESFSICSGLELNADKTEIFKITNFYTDQRFQFRYLGTQSIVETKDSIKINGIYFGKNHKETLNANFRHVTDKIKAQHESWANRNLTLLGKILIHKTYGISQLIYASRVLNWKPEQHKQLRNLFYKFIWNSNYEHNKAPDRINRQKMLTPIKYGGFGMVDHEEITKAMNCKQVMQNL